MSLSIDAFPEFFQAVHGVAPFRWQTRLANQVFLTGSWPDVIDLPTASGKTACLDIAVFLLALDEKYARRIFFVVDRRVIVDEAFERMRKVAKKLLTPEPLIVRDVAAALRRRCGDKESSGKSNPLHVVELRGGIYRDQFWARDLLQPTIIASTVDQVGSRLLFRGYGVSRSSQPIHAALAANDSLIFLDEAHASRAFAQTLEQVKRFRGWRKEDIGRPFATVEMTATPSRISSPEKRFALLHEEHRDDVLKARLSAAKPTQLVPMATRPNGVAAYAKQLAGEALKLAAEPGIDAVAVMANRISTARHVFEILLQELKEPDTCHLLIGRMRSIDRDDLMENLNNLKSGAARDTSRKTFVVSTQCLEVGADFDFDGLVTEAASIDALLQRFGRLDRLGRLQGAARAVVAGPSDRLNSKDPDPIYGDALKETWAWLTAGGVTTADFGIASFGRADQTVAERLAALPRDVLRRHGKDAVVLSAAHLDTLVQTNPAPISPNIGLYLHGVSDPEVDVNVVFRADLGSDWAEWKKIVELCPPVSAEALPVRLWDLRAWMTGERPATNVDADVQGMVEEEEEVNRASPTDPRIVLLWDQERGGTTWKPSSIRPGDTVVIPADAPNIDRLGYIPQSGRTETGIRDWGDRATYEVRRKVSIRLTPALLSTELYDLLKPIFKDEKNRRERLREIQEVLESTEGASLVEHASEADDLVAHPLAGYILIGRSKQFASEEDAGNDNTSFTGEPQLLDEHTSAVEDHTSRFASRLQSGLAETFKVAAKYHDTGKVDVRIQTFFRQGDRLSAEFAPALAKSGFKGGRTPLRHEFLSLLFAEVSGELKEEKELALHLIGSHHGYCRPLAAPEPFDDCPDTTCHNSFVVTREQRRQAAASLISSGATKRFWKLTRRFGWWGLPYLESILRLADWKASSNGEGK